jgi:4'-phosphopantetheinyl transferase EntD
VAQKLFGSISHSTSTALAVVSTHPVGLDIEAIFTPQTAVELTGGIIDNTNNDFTASPALSARLNPGVFRQRERV